MQGDATIELDAGRRTFATGLLVDLIGAAAAKSRPRSAGYYR
jgi:hypothetical protein